MRVTGVSHRIWLCEDGDDCFAKLEYVAIIWNGECLYRVGETDFSILTHRERELASALLEGYRSVDHIGETQRLLPLGRGRTMAMFPPGLYSFATEAERT